MKKLIRLRESRRARLARLAASTVVVAVVVAGAAGIAAGRGDAAPRIKADKASLAHKEAKFKHPKLEHGLLTIRGTQANDKIVLRLKAGRTDILQVDVGDDGTADFD